MAEKIGNDTFDVAASAAVAVAAFNWASVEFFDTDILLDVLELSGDSLTAAYGLFGVLSVIVLYNTYAWYAEAM